MLLKMGLVIVQLINNLRDKSTLSVIIIYNVFTISFYLIKPFLSKRDLPLVNGSFFCLTF